MNLDKLSEGIHYELIPVEEVSNDQAWDLRILEGQFVETVIRFGNIRFNQEQDCLNFNFLVVSTPDPDATVENEDLQILAGQILNSVLEKAAAEDTLVTKEYDDRTRENDT